jgi:hypothetical protein
MEFQFLMMKLFKYIIFLLLLVLLSACEKEIEVKIPDAEPKLVVEGFIEPNQPPIILLTRSMGYFEPTDIETLQQVMVRDAKITFKAPNKSILLDVICMDALPDSLYPLVSSLTGISIEQLLVFNYCIYTTFDLSVWGQSGASYSITIDYNSKEYQSTTIIPKPVPLDSLWFEKRNPQEGSRGLIWAKISDPPGLGNAYRIYTRRIGKDNSFTPAWGSVFEDKFFDGKTFDFFFYRGLAGENDRDRGFFTEGDSVVVKFCTIDQAVFKFLRDFETEVSNNGNPFAAPTTITSNISGGALGYWGGYGAVYDTIVCVQ